MNRKVWVYDIETLKSCFTYTALNIDTEEIVQYVIHKERNDIPKLLDHLRDCKGHIGFNNINFDYPVLHEVFSYLGEWMIWLDGVDDRSNWFNFVERAHEEAQRLIAEQNKTFEEKNWNGIKEKDFLIPQLDLFRLWHFNNKARTQSLKGLEINMNLPNVMDMPINHDKEDITLEEVNDILKYNLNDVLATYEFYKASKDKIDLRKDLRTKYGLKCSSWPDSKIGEELVLKLYSQKSGQDYWDVKKMRTHRSQIALGSCIFDYIKFDTPEFQNLLSTLKSKVIESTKGAFKESIIYKGFKYDYGTGGIHGCIKAGIYEADEDYVIIDADVASLYPSIAVVNGLFPEHLGKEFCEVYEGILKERIKAKKDGNIAISEALKLSLNSVYGKSNDKFSFLFDPEFTMKITLNGQLMLTMLAEKLITYLSDITILQVNTDGITIRILRKELEAYYFECHQWELETNLALEFVEYSKMVIGDVNNYAAQKLDGKIKYKGRYEVIKDWHKDNSFKIVSLALSDYFFKGTPVEETILTHKNIYDFCGRQKFKKTSYGETHTLVYDDKGLATDKIEIQQKNVRYYISKPGSNFVKVYTKGTIEQINKGFEVTIFNKYVEKPFEEYKVNYDFYIRECYKEINNIINNQLSLF